MNIFNLILKYLSERAEEKVTQSVSRALAPVGPYLKQMSLGIGLLILSIPCFMLTLLFLTGALFLYLLHGADWSIPALWTSLATLVMGAGFSIGGVSILKKKYPSAV